VNRRAVAVFSMIGIALIAAGCAESSAPQSASASNAPQAAYQTLKTGSPQRARTDAPICETHDELVAAAYEYDGGHTPDISGCTALTKGAEVKVLAAGVSGDTNAVQVDSQGHTGWTKSYYLEEPAQ
jgi:hypothetical protein